MAIFGHDLQGHQDTISKFSCSEIRCKKEQRGCIIPSTTTSTGASQQRRNLKVPDGNHFTFYFWLLKIKPIFTPFLI